MATLDTPAIEDGQADRGAAIAIFRPGVEQVAQAQRLESDQRRQADIRIIIGPRDVDALRRRLGAQPCRDDIGTAADQRDPRIGGQADGGCGKAWPGDRPPRSEEHTSELQSLMRTSYA